jgi:hypothetical protein
MLLRHFVYMVTDNDTDATPTFCSYRDNYQYSKILHSIIDNVRNDIKPYLFSDSYKGNNT